MDRAYSLLTVKAVQEDKRIIEGVATSPEPDRLGDIVEPLGIQFKNPTPLLWQHDTRMPVGLVKFNKPTKDGMSFQASLPQIDEPGVLKDRIDEAWQSIKAGLVLGVSIGFRALERALMKDGGIRFLASEVLELSLVTIPAHQGAKITTIRSIDTELRAASGREQADDLLTAFVEKTSAPGVSGPTKLLKTKGTKMPKTVAEQISAFEATRVAKAARMEEIMEKSAETGETLDAEQSEEYDGLEGEVKSIDAHLKRLADLQKAQAAKAKPVTEVKTVEGASEARGGSVVTSMKRELPPGIEFTRYAMCLMLAKGDIKRASDLAQAHLPDEPRIQRALNDQYFMKATVAAGTTTDATWASPLVDYQQFSGDFIDFLRPQTILGKFGNNGIPSLRRVPFNIQIPAQTSGGSGYWVGEGQPKPLTKFDFDRITMRWTKVASISVLTEELIRFSNPNAETLVRDSLAAAVIERMDIDFVDPAKAAVANVSPASITNGITAIVSSGTDADAVRNDVGAVMAAFITANLSPADGVWIMNPNAALAISLMRNPLGQKEFPDITMMGGRFEGLPVITSKYVPNGVVILVNASDIYLADDGQVTVDASREACLQMLDNPTNDSTTPTATTMVSLWQTNSVGLRAERFVNWQRRRTAAVQWLEDVDWGTASGSDA